MGAEPSWYAADTLMIYIGPMRVPRRRTSPVSRRLRRLAVLELVNIVWLPLLCYGWLGFPLSVANWAGTAATGLLLAQGALYWWLKTRVGTEPGMRMPGLSAFAVLRVVNPVLLAAVLAIIVAALVTEQPGRAVPGLLFWLLAVLEYVNYFHYQLMYDNKPDLRWLRVNGLKRAHLAHDLDRRTRYRSRNRLGAG